MKKHIESSKIFFFVLITQLHEFEIIIKKMIIIMIPITIKATKIKID